MSHNDCAKLITTFSKLNLLEFPFCHRLLVGLNGSLFSKPCVSICSAMGRIKILSFKCTAADEYHINVYNVCIVQLTRGQSNLTKSASRGANSPVRGHPRGSKVVPLNSWGRVSY